MATRITNQAILDYSYNGLTERVQSNVASANVTDPIQISKHSIEDRYRDNDELTYIISFINNSSSTLSNVKITDDLGTFLLDTVSVTPLTFMEPAYLYINGRFNSVLTPTVGEHSVEFNILSLTPGAQVQIIYKAKVNDYAPLDSGSEIENIVKITATDLNNHVEAKNIVSVDEYADVMITKVMSPSEITDGGAIAYDFIIYNYGNTPADSIVLTDEFDPAPAGISVYVDGVLAEASEYSYSGGILTLPVEGATIDMSLPAAEFEQEPDTGLIKIIPSSKTVKVTGTI